MLPPRIRKKTRGEKSCNRWKSIQFSITTRPVTSGSRWGTSHWGQHREASNSHLQPHVHVLGLWAQIGEPVENQQWSLLEVVPATRCTVQMFLTASAATEKVFVPLELASFFYQLQCQQQITGTPTISIFWAAAGTRCRSCGRLKKFN